MKVKVGENRKMNCGLTAKIIRYNNANDIDVEFEDGYIAPNMKYSCFRQGEISNDPLIKVGDGSSIRKSIMDKIIENNPNLIIDFDNIKNKKIRAICRSNSHEGIYSIYSLSRKSPNRTGGGCAKCANCKLKVNEEFDSELANITSSLVRASDYKGVFKPIRIHCLKCDGYFESTPHTILKTSNPTCLIENPKLFSHDIFVEKLSKLKPQIEVMGKYINIKTSIAVRCKKHQIVYMARPESLLYGKGAGCKECNNENMRKMRILSQDEFIERMKIINKKIEILGEYRGGKEYVAVKCKECGYEWLSLGSNLLHGYGCPICNVGEKYTTSSFKKKIKQINPYIEVTGEYINNHTPISVQCKKCGNDNWKPRPGQLFRGDGCPNCCRSHTSVNEEFLALMFEIQFGKDKVVRRSKTDIGAELDIYIPELKIAFEPGFWGYHKKRIDYDIKKISKCKDKNINLRVIYFGCGKDIIEPMKKNDEVYFFENNLENLEDKIRCFEKVCASVGVFFDFNDSLYKFIDEEAKRRARKKDPEQVRNEFNKLNSQFEMIGEYLTSKDPIEFRCRVCNTTHKALKYNMIKRKTCWNPDCTSGVGVKSRRVLTMEEFLTEYVDPREDIERSECLSTSRFNHIKVKCKNCGGIWNAPYYSLVYGRKHRCNYTKTHAEFVEEMKRKRPDIEIIGEYKTSKSLIEYRFKGEDNIRIATADSLCHYYASKTKK